ncbi:MAG: hypothetical protein LIO87_06225 [Eubacterium sp.]|nr:hypothetical protein [Eubacterium sp.]
MDLSKPLRLKKGGAYYAVKESSSIIAFTVGQNLKRHRFKITASHLYSHYFKIKKAPTLSYKV